MELDHPGSCGDIDRQIDGYNFAAATVGSAVNLIPSVAFIIGERESSARCRNDSHKNGVACLRRLRKRADVIRRWTGRSANVSAVRAADVLNKRGALRCGKCREKESEQE